MKTKSVLFLLVVLILATSFKTEIISYPKPEGVENMMFYVQRTINSNTIVYTLNQDKDGNLNEEEPIKAYWIKYAQGGKVDPLTYIQKKFAYGVNSQIFDKKNKSYIIEFVSYHKRQFYLLRSAVDNKYHVYSNINNKLTILTNILVKIEGGTFWVPNIKHVVLKAMDPIANTEVTEIIKP